MKYREFRINNHLGKTFVLAVLCLVLNQSSAQYEISKYSINNGGGVSSGTNYQVTSTIGQKEFNTTSTGGGYRLSSGFWTVGQRSESIFSNGFED